MKELERERTQFKGNRFQVFVLIFFLVVDIFAFFFLFFFCYISQQSTRKAQSRQMHVG